MRSLKLFVAIAFVLGATSAPAAAAEVLSADLSVAEALQRSCIAGPLPAGAGHAQRSITAPDAGWVTARLDAAAGDWDLAVFDDASGKRVAGSAFFGANEVAQGFVAGGERLTVQACRVSGPADTATLTVESKAVQASAPQTLSLVRVATPNATRRKELTSLGLDLTEHGGRGFVEVVLHGADDAQRLRESKFLFTTEIGDLAKRAERDRAGDRSFRRNVSASALPSGRTAGYRKLADYSQEMKALVDQNPNLVKPITLPLKTLTGMSVEGIEITEDVAARDGKPVFLQMGVHHAREWPSGEHAIEWAYELVNGYRANNARVRNLMARTRTIVVPIVNPEGFTTSREAAAALDDGRGGPDETPNLAIPYEYQRKNCRVNNTAEDDFSSTADDDPEAGDCTQTGQPNVGISQFGVDPNRNYGGFWGGPGASPSGEAPFGDFSQDYRGTGPFSEPETRNVRALVSSRHVTTLITNHTFSNLLLRPPGIRAQGPPVDEPVYKALGDSMAAANGYTSEPSYMLYDTTGGTEDWTYYATGGLGFTFEIGPSNFHPPYADTVAEYDGTAATAKGGGGNREAYFRAMESTADASRHSVVSGGAPAGAVLRLQKSFETSTSPVIDVAGEEGEPILFDDKLETTMEVPKSGRFEWHVNPSTRPVVAQDQGRVPTGGKPSEPISRTGQLASQPPCPSYFEPGSPETCVAGGVTDEQFSVPANSPTVDNGFFDVKISFPEQADMDLEVYKADAQGKPVGDPLGASASSNNPEQTKIGPDPEPGNYVARVVNFSGGTTYDLDIEFSGPLPFKPGVKESWTLTCEVGGQVRATAQVQIDRGQRKAVDLGSACPAPPAGSSGTGDGGGSDGGRGNSRGNSSRRCVASRGGVRGRAVGAARLGRTRKAQRRVLRRATRFRRTRRGYDRYCVNGGGQLRIGYPTRFLNVRIGAQQRRRVRSRAILAISSSKRFRIRGVRVGMGARALRRRLRGERRVRVFKDVWYVARARRAALVFKVRGGKVRELGLADRRLTGSRRAAQRLLRSYRGGRRG